MLRPRPGFPSLFPQAACTSFDFDETPAIASAGKSSLPYTIRPRGEPPRRDQAHEKPEDVEQLPELPDIAPDADWPAEKHDICLCTSPLPHTGQLRLDSSFEENTNCSKTSLQDLHLYS